MLLCLGLYSKHRSRVLSFNQRPPDQITKPIRASSPILIKIEEINLVLPVESSQIKNGVWEVSEKSASFLESSARPGEEGNIVIYGHNKLKIFGKLNNRKLLGKAVEIQAEDNTIHSYRIVEMKTVNPDEINEVMPTDHEVLTLYTCTGFLDSKRLVLKAYPLKTI